MQYYPQGVFFRGIDQQDFGYPVGPNYPYEPDHLDHSINVRALFVESTLPDRSVDTQLDLMDLVVQTPDTYDYLGDHPGSPAVSCGSPVTEGDLIPGLSHSGQNESMYWSSRGRSISVMTRLSLAPRCHTIVQLTYDYTGTSKYWSDTNSILVEPRPN